MTASVVDLSMFKEIRELRMEVNRLEYLKYIYEDGANDDLDLAMIKEIEKRIYKRLPEKRNRMEIMQKVLKIMKGDSHED